MMSKLAPWFKSLPFRHKVYWVAFTGSAIYLGMEWVLNPNPVIEEKEFKLGRNLTPLQLEKLKEQRIEQRQAQNNRQSKEYENTKNDNNDTK